ncbi:hypothetical protein KDA_63390 [Dictyobacter alpinus]|uniref:NADH:ubiquinone reductase (non-electrogenic) n=1 Tax=Dictyobacter alpinus TaxID=2014873 RepID=A0A402BHL5_9CHLR|nr:NAD(P)/FAD-dependent oxidoreductase [Dictyobacter alpinus]GCE30855.1 hypothetical protein KDA_63390 [Dictyobacter alpinus]
MQYLQHSYVRRSLIGFLAGIVSSFVLLLLMPYKSVGYLFAGIVLAIIYALSLKTRKLNYADSMLTTAALGMLLWICFSCLLLPLLRGQMPQWTAPEMRQLFPDLVAWVLYGGCLGLLLPLSNHLVSLWAGPDLTPVRRSAPAVTTRIVIIGGGFAGMTTAEQLEHTFEADPSVSITLISATNSLLFTPMLAEVAGGSLEPSHICHSLRTSLRRTQVVHGYVERIDSQREQVLLATENHVTPQAAIPYDHLVLAVGSVSNYMGIDSIASHSFGFKSIEDAIRIRGHIIAMLEYAERETNPDKRQAMLTFVIAGAGFAGTELAGALNDLVRGALPYYPGIQSEEVKIVLLHSRDRILPELSSSLADYAMTHMEARGVTIRLHTRLTAALDDRVILNTAEELPTRTLVWTAGVKPHPLMQTLPANHSKQGAIIVDKYLAVTELPGIWALGDCAQVTDAINNQISPPTAQFALRQAKTVAHNIGASVHQQPLKGFHFDALGILCVVGYQTACAEIKGFRFSGLFAWMLWRGIYLSKLPGLERKIRVLSDWIIELFFPRDIVQTIDLDEQTKIGNPESNLPTVASSRPQG